MAGWERAYSGRPCRTRKIISLLRPSHHFQAILTLALAQLQAGKYWFVGRMMAFSH